MGVSGLCQRSHSGICGIPPGVTLGYGARVNEQIEIQGKPKVAKLSTKILGEVLVQAKEQYGKVVKLLIVMPNKIPEYSELLDRESKLNSIIKQIEQQISQREMR